jgi:anaerobic magnesium-protoporphyrin IX monomethyl ester cyclase
VDLSRVKAICDEIIRRDLRVNWSVYNGIRVDRIDRELLEKLKASGCYRVNIGIESGNQGILDGIHKGITLEQARLVSRVSKKVGIETIGFYMIGLPGETEETIKQTIDLAVDLDLDLSKVSIAIPLPGTRLFEEWAAEGRIKTFDWEKYNFHSKTIYDHPNLDTPTILKYYNLFYRRVYLRPRYLWRRLWRGVKTGDLFFDAYYFLKILFKFGW